ncbi:MAG TPA: ABC transporter substrate-binding protein, partial [Candidatus Binatia bacterium]
MSKRFGRLSRREFLRTMISAGALVSTASLAVPRHAYSQSPSKNRVTIAHGVGVYSLNPYAVTTSPIQAAWGSVMETLIDFDYEKRQYRGILAENWELDATRLQFKLRKGIRFHDGTPLGSKDVAASLTRMLTDKESLVAPSLRNLKEIAAPDDLTVILTLKKADANALEDLNNRVIMKQSVAEKMGEADNKPIGTGPFRFVSWQRSAEFVMGRSESYWGPPAKIDQVIYKTIKEDAARIAALEAGQVDLISTIPPHEVERLKSNPRLTLQRVEGLRPIFLVLSPAYKPLDNPKVRRAIT